MHPVYVRAAISVAGLAYSILAAGLVFRIEPIVALWPWTEGKLSYMFLGAVSGALAAGSLWSGLSGRVQASLPSLSGLTFIFAASGLYLSITRSAGIISTVICFAATAAAGSLAVVTAEPSPRSSPMPRFVSVSCIIYSLVLLAAAGGLLARYKIIFPWQLATDTSIMFGIMFLGLSFIYAATAIRNRADEAMVVMLGFLAYDIILIPPFLQHLANVPEERLFSLIIYLAVLIYSLIISLLFLRRQKISEQPPRAQGQRPSAESVD